MGKFYSRKKIIFNSYVIAIFVALIAFFYRSENVKAIAVGTKWEYSYTGEYQTFTAPESTWYKV